MLYLDTGVHFHKIEIFVFIQQKLNGSCIFVIHGFGCLYCNFTHFFTKFRGNDLTRGLFHYLLMTALDGAVTFSQVNNMTKLVTHDLKFHMTWFFNIFFNIHGIIGKSLYRL